MPSAGDLATKAAVEFITHQETCTVDQPLDCQDCRVTYHRLRVAVHVWRNSRHKAVTPQVQPDKRRPAGWS